MTTAAAAARPPRRWPRATTLVFWALTALTGALVIYPLVIIGIRTFFPEAGFSLQVFAVAASLPLGSLIANTAILAVSSTVLALIVGGIFAWLNERTDAGLGLIGDVVPLTSLFVPNIAAVAGWVVLFEPRIGYVNVAFRNLLGIEGNSGPFDIYSFPGMIFVTTLFLIPYGYLLLSAGLRNLDPSLEEASRISGAPLRRTLLRVTFPSILPSILDAAILMLITGMTIFSVPLVLGGRAEIEVLSTEIYRFIVRYPPQMDAALVLSIGMLLMVQVLLLLRGQLLKRTHRATIGGKGFRRPSIRLGRYRWLGRVSGLIYVFLVGILPILALILVAIQPFWAGVIDWTKVSLDNFVDVLEYPATVDALTNSLILGAVSGVVLLALVGFLVALARYVGSRARQTVDTLANLPATIPHIVIAVAFLFAFAGAPFMLHGTMLILVMAYFVEYLPYAVRSVQSANADVGDELPDASRIFGAGPFKTLRRVVIPLSMSGLVAGWIIVFAHVFSEVTISSLLSGVGNITVGRLLVDFLESGSFPRLAAVSLVMTAVTAIPVLLLMWLSRRHFTSRL